MKYWIDLTEEQQADARECVFFENLRQMAEAGPLSFGIYKTHPVYEAFKECYAEVERLRTPWYLADVLAQHETIRAFLQEMTESFIKRDTTIYIESDEHVVELLK